ncbi:MAG: hypothetical protein QM737_16090 [Ferruginibacter sp.]
MGFTQEQIAMQLGMSVSMVKQVETNRKSLPGNRLIKLAALEIQMIGLKENSKRDQPASIKLVNHKETERYVAEANFQILRCRRQAMVLGKKLRKMELEYAEIVASLQNMDTMEKLNLDKRDPLTRNIFFARPRLEKKLALYSLPAQTILRNKIALLRAEEALHQSIHPRYVHTGYEKPTIISHLKQKEMNYTVSLISSRADCQALIDTANDDKDSLVYRKTGLQRQMQSASSNTVGIEADLAAAVAEIEALNTVIANLPPGNTREETSVKLTKAEYKKFLLEQRKGNYGSTALIGKEYDIACVEQQIAETDAFIQSLTTRMNELPAA